MTTSISATETVAAPVAEVWALLTDPSRHHEADGTGMVGKTITPGPLERAGQVFTMAMTYRSGATVEHYRSDNHVTLREPDRAIAWATATEGGPPLGWTWRYDLDPEGPDATRVTVTYDWTATPPDNAARFGVPLVDVEDLRRSLAGLVAALT